MQQVLDLGGGKMGPGGRAMRLHERTTHLRFVIHLFQSLETERVRSQMLRLASLPLWHALSPARRDLELYQHPELLTLWQRMEKRDAKARKKVRFLIRRASLLPRRFLSHAVGAL